MALINVDTTTEGLAQPAYEPLEPGIYELEIVNNLEVKPSKNPSSDGKNYGRIAVELKDGDSGKTVRDWLPMSPKMKWKFNQFTASAGVTEVEPGQVDLADFQGQFVRATISQETYLRNDQTTGLRNVVKGYLYEND